MKKLRKILSLLLALTMLFALAACGGGDDTAKTDESKTSKVEIQTGENVNSALDPTIKEEDPANDKYTVLNVGWHNSSFGDLSPYGTYGSSKPNYLHTIYETLAVQTEVGQAVEDMQLVCAKSVTKIDEKTYQFVLWETLADSEGNKIDAYDVEWGFNLAKEQGMYTFIGCLEKATAIDESTVELKFASAGLGEVENMLNTTPVVSKAAYDSTGDGMATKIIATGPYVFKDMVAGSTMTLVKNENYWQTDSSARSPYSKQNVSEIHFQVIAENNQMAIALQTGQIATTTSTKAALVSSFVNADGTIKEGSIVTLNPSTKGWTMFYNGSVGNSPLADNQALRQAVCYAINPEDFIMVGQKGVANPIYDMASQICADALDKWVEEDYYNYDVEKAKEKLAEAGYEPGEVTLRVLGANNDSDKLISQLIQANLTAVGINCEILSYDTALYNTYKSEPDKWDIVTDKPSNDYVVATWNMYFDHELNGGSYGKFFFVDDELQEMLDVVTTAEGHTEENIDEVHDYLTDKAYCYSFSSAQDFLIGNADILKSIGYANYGIHNVLPGCCEFSDEYLASLD